METSLRFSRAINCVYGNNGVGKTNLLDAVYYLCMSKSFFHFPDSFSISHSEQGALIKGGFRLDDGTIDTIALNITKQSNAKTSQCDKVLKINEKQYKRFSEHIGKFPIVMVSPADTAIINSSAEERRRFINQLISQVDKKYLTHWQNYRKLLLQRNKILKDEETFNSDLLESIDYYLAESAEYIYKSREYMSSLLNDSISDYYSKLSGDSERVAVRLVSDLQRCDFKTILHKNIDRDRACKYTTVGVHRDDFEFEIGLDEMLYPVRRCASQGQQKSFLIALKLAQFSIMRELNGGTAPILLLDDIIDKLDMNRVEYLLDLVSGDNFGQIFITESNKVRISSLIEKIGSESRNFYIDNGKITVSE